MTSGLKMHADLHVAALHAQVPEGCSFRTLLACVVKVVCLGFRVLGGVIAKQEGYHIP